jgi:hypothetical protein
VGCDDDEYRGEYDDECVRVLLLSSGFRQLKINTLPQFCTTVITRGTHRAGCHSSRQPSPIYRSIDNNYNTFVVLYPVSSRCAGGLRFRPNRHSARQCAFLSLRRQRRVFRVYGDVGPARVLRGCECENDSSMGK